MKNPTPFAIHYLLDGVAKHFFALALSLTHGDATILAVDHAAQGARSGTGRKLARQMFDKAGVTQVRWNTAI